MSNPHVPLEPGCMYHIWTHANGNENLFRTDENYRYFLEKYTLHVYPVVETFAYCLMPNHLHLMVRVRDENVLLVRLQEKKPVANLQGFQNLEGFGSQQFSNCFNSYTKAYNIRYERMGGYLFPVSNVNPSNPKAILPRSLSTFITIPFIMVSSVTSTIGPTAVGTAIYTTNRQSWPGNTASIGLEDGKHF